MKKKALISSILTIALCVCLIAGSTLALFTSESTVNVAVTSGKVSVVATVENFDHGSTLGNHVDESKFELTEEDGMSYITLDKIVPGDYVTFDIRVHNASNVTVKYRTIIKTFDDNGLWDGLVVTINGTELEEKTTKWDVLEVGSEDDVLSVKVALPEDAGNDYQDLSCKFSYSVEAIQGNAPDVWDGESVETPAYDAETKTYTVANAAQFVGLMEKPAARGTTIKLESSIDFGGATIDGFFVGGVGQFDAIFDGQGYTISNFKIESDEPYMTGLFGNIGVQNGSTIKNLTVRDAVVIGKAQVGVIAGGINDGAVVENCHVENCTIIGTQKVGAVVGYTLGSTVTGCSAKDCVVYCASSDVTESDKVVGFVNTGSTVDNNTSDNVTVNRGVTVNSVVSTAEELAVAGAKGGSIILTDDIVVTDDWTPIKVGTPSVYHPIAEDIVIDGCGHSISGLNHSLVGASAARNITIKNLTIKDSDISGVGDYNDTNCGAFVSYLDGYNDSLTLDNCHTVNVNVIATYDENNKGGTGFGAGALVGYNGASNATISISNCSATGGSVTNSNGSAAGIIGFWQLGANATISNCKVSGVVINGENNAKTGAIAGTVNGVGTLTLEGCTFDDGYRACGRTVGDEVFVVIK